MRFRSTNVPLLMKTARFRGTEGDLLCGSCNSQIATLVERHTRYVMLVKIDSKDSETVAKALIKHVGKFPQELYKSLTRDRGTEMAGHKRFTVATDGDVYFCDPKHPWHGAGMVDVIGSVHDRGHVVTTRRAP